MRLRLVIRRHNLPDAAILWSVEDSENPTISQLLDQVNEVIPLESGGDWGLEDYAVEIRGSGRNFECLHFHLVREILYEDDEIFIRPLLSHDLKLRKVSGRHQISSDGRHLFDGWVFGRPRPRGLVDRPAIEIPPRKRRRITYFEGSDSTFDENSPAIEGQAEIGSDSDGNRQLILSANFENDDDDDDDEDFELNDEDDEEDEDEDDEENEENIFGEDSNGHNDALLDLGAMEGSEDELDDQGIQKDSMSNLPELRMDFPEAPTSVCESVLKSYNDDINKARNTLSQAFKRSTLRKAIVPTSSDQETLRTIYTRSKSKLYSKYKESSVGKKVPNTDDDGNPPPHDEDVLLLQYYDMHGLPAGSIKNGKALSHMAEIASSTNTGILDGLGRRTLKNGARTFANRITRTVRFSKSVSRDNASTPLTQEDSDESEDEDFDPKSNVVDQEMSSAKSSDQSSDDEETNGKHPDESSSSENDSSSSSETTSDSDSETDSDSEPDEISSKAAELQADAIPKLYSSARDLPREQKTLQKIPVPPGEGKNSTRNRNRRRRIANLLQRYKSKGILPAGMTIKEFEQFQVDSSRKAENRTEISRESDGDILGKHTEFETRRQTLLNSLATAGVEVESQSIVETAEPIPLCSVSKQPERSGTIAGAESETSFVPSIGESTHPISNHDAEEDAKPYAPAEASDCIESPHQPPMVDTEPTTAESAPRPRRKIDLGAAGRLLFGALGVRAPKSKDDHEKVRNELVKDIRRSKASAVVETTIGETEGPNVDKDPEAWREIINLRAVECCYEGVELSPAPFPFVQRWDPQQQGGYFKQGNRSGKGKRNQRNQHQYYEDGQQSSNKRKRNQNSYDTYQDSHDQYTIADAPECEGTVRRNEAEEVGSLSISNMQVVYGDGIEGAVDEQIMKDVQEAATSQAIDEDDLPRLPDDLSILPNFSNEDVKSGMVIAFKQLILSEATNWQPQLSTYRTAVLIKASENGSLELRLARRDREQTQNHYDEQTGERIYGKFDMPTEDDHNDDEEDGFLEVTLDEIIEPKIVQLAPESLSAPASLPDLPDNTTQAFADNPTSSSHTDHLKLSKTSPEAPATVNEETNSYQDIGALEKGAHSPKFNGLGSISSQLAQFTSSQSHLDPATPLTVHSHETSGPNNVLPEVKSATSKVHNSKLSVLSSLPSQVSDRGHQPDYPIPSDDILHQFDELDTFPAPSEESILTRNENPPAGESSTVDDRFPSNHSRSASEGSSADLPTLAEVFSTARSSVGPKHEQQPWFPQKTDVKDANKIQESYDKEIEALDALLEVAEDPEHVTFKASVEQGTATSQIESESKNEFSIPPGSQKVDLTLSSDGEIVAKDNHSDDSYDDAYGLPRDSNRAEGKTRTSRRQRNNNSQTPTQRVTKTRNTRRKNMTKS